MNQQANFYDSWIERPTARDDNPVNRSAMIPPDRLAAFCRLDPRRAIGTVLVDYAIIAVAIALCEMFWSWPLYLLAITIIGARQIGVASIGLHDGVHRLLVRRRRLNDLAARAILWTASIGLVQVFIGLDFDGYRRYHFGHHRYTNNRQYDPQLPDGIFDVDEFPDMPLWRRVLRLLFPLTGIPFLLSLWVTLRRDWSWPRRLRFAVGALAVAAGLALSIYPVVLFAVYWIVPLVTWGAFVNSIRALAEHYPPERFVAEEKNPPLYHTRDVLPTWFDRCFIVTRGVNYHLTHHLFPAVPFYRLKELQREIAASASYRRFAHVTHGYHRAIGEIYFGLNPVKG